METPNIPIALTVVALALAGLAPVAAQPQTTKVYEIELHEFEGGGMHLDPTRLTANAGQEVRLVVHNPETNTAPHNLVVCGDPPDEDSECADRIAFVPTIPAGEARTLTFTIDQPGTYEYYCEVLGHKQATPGMRGTIVIEGDAVGTNEAPAAAAPLALAVLALAALALRRK